MAKSAFVSADIGKITKFEKDSEEVMKEFSKIKKEFEKINDELLKKWIGEGAESYKNETNHIMENIGDIKDILKEINESVYADIKDNYMELDKQLGEFNRNPESSEK